MDWSKMEEINFWYIDRKNYSNFEFKEFKKEFIENISSKFIQLYIHDKPVLIAGKELYHKDILELSLKKFDIKFKTRLNSTKDEIPIEEGEGYKMVGAGRVKMFDEETLYFYDNSMDYLSKIKGTNKNHLEEIFGSERVDSDKLHRDLSFFVSI